MANTWRATASAVAAGTNKSLIDIFNSSSSSRTIKVYRIFQFNNGTAAVTATFSANRIDRITAASAGTTLTPVAHDTTNAGLNANTTAGTGRTTTASDIFRRYLWLWEEPTTTGVTQANWEILVPFCEIWNAGYADSNIQPLTCNASTNQGVQVFNTTTVTSSSNDLEIEFTDS